MEREGWKPGKDGNRTILTSVGSHSKLKRGKKGQKGRMGRRTVGKSILCLL
jgi:hypothetical protein